MHQCVWHQRCMSQPMPANLEACVYLYNLQHSKLITSVLKVINLKKKYRDLSNKKLWNKLLVAIARGGFPRVSGNPFCKWAFAKIGCLKSKRLKYSNRAVTHSNRTVMVYSLKLQIATVLNFICNNTVK